MNSEIEKFINACIIKGKCEEVGDSKNGNKQYDIINGIYYLLKKEMRLNEFCVLLTHENPYVRLWAAAYTLQTSPKQAEKTLEDLSNIKGRPVAFNSKMTLREWRKGILKL